MIHSHLACVKSLYNGRYNVKLIQVNLELNVMIFHFYLLFLLTDNIKQPFCTGFSFSLTIFNFQYFLLPEINISFLILKERFHGSAHAH